VVSKEGYDNYQQAVTIEGGKTNSFNASLPARAPEPTPETRLASAPEPPPKTPPARAAEPPPKTPPEVPAAGKVKPAKEEVEAPSAIPLPPGGGGGPSAVPKTGQLLVTANVSGAKISVDGSSEPNWVTPYSSTIDRPAGTYQVVVSKEGYDNYQQSVTIEGGKTSTVNARLSLAGGEVVVMTTPPGLEVFIDGKSIGPSPARAAVAAGSHRYSVTRAGWPPYEGTVTIESGKMRVVKVTLSVGAQ